MAKHAILLVVAVCSAGGCGTAGRLEILALGRPRQPAGADSRRAADPESSTGSVATARASASGTSGETLVTYASHQPARDPHSAQHPAQTDPGHERPRIPAQADEAGREFLPPPAIPTVPSALDAIESGRTAAAAPAAPLTLDAFENLACQNNPTLAQARAQVDAAFGKAIQAGLWPNPTVGYMQEQIGVAGTPGEFLGGFVEQKLVTADKLDLSRGKFLERTRTAEWLALAQEYRVLNDVRLHFFRTLGRQGLVQIRQQLLKNAEDRLVTARERYNVGQATRAEVHEINVHLQQERLNLLMAENDYRQVWEELTTLAGVDLSPTLLVGGLEHRRPFVEWDQALERLLAESPELQAAYAKLRADQITLKREKVEPIPNVFVRAAGGRNYEAREDVANVEVFLEVPLFDWNQGTVKQAESDLFRQQGEIRRTELVLRRRLGDRYRQYITAWQHVENYEQVILPESRRAYETQLDSYKEDRIEWDRVLDAEREYFQLRANYVANLIALKESEVLIAGYLLHDGLMAPAGPTPPGHIDAVPKPR